MTKKLLASLLALCLLVGMLPLSAAAGEIAVTNLTITEATPGNAVDGKVIITVTVAVEPADALEFVKVTCGEGENKKTATKGEGSTWTLEVDEPTGSDATYTFTASISDDTTYEDKTSSEKTVTVPAKVTEPPKITITPNANYEGASVIAGIEITQGGTLTTLPAAPTREGYTCDGWFTAATGGTEVTTSTTFNANTTIYAHWTKNETDPPSHTHAAADDAVWQKNATNHWKVCKEEGCNEKVEEATHTYDDDADTTCNVCGYTRTVSSGSGSGGGSTSTTPVTPPAEEVKPTTSVTDGTANSEVTGSQGSSLVEAAKQPGTDEVTVKVEPSSDVTAANVTIPASTVSGVGAANADLKVETPVADITLPSEALRTLGTGSGSVAVSAAINSDDTVSITVKKDNTAVETLSQPMKASIPAKDATSGTVAVIVNADGTRTIIKKSVADSGEMAMQLKGSATVKLVDNTRTFTDTANDWSKAGIDFATSHELFVGTSATTFSPNQAMTRGMIVTVLHRLEDTPAGSTVNFDDVKANDYFADAVAWANQNEIALGTGTGFNPNGNVTRQELAAFLFRYAKSIGLDTSRRSSLNGFTDGSAASSYSRDALEWCVNTGIIRGMGDNTLNPLGNASRAEVATMLQRFVVYINK